MQAYLKWLAAKEAAGAAAPVRPPLPAASVARPVRAPAGEPPDENSMRHYLPAFGIGLGGLLALGLLAWLILRWLV